MTYDRNAPKSAVTQCGARIGLELADGTLNGHYHFANGECDNEPSYDMGGPA